MFDRHRCEDRGWYRDRKGYESEVTSPLVDQGLLTLIQVFERVFGSEPSSTSCLDIPPPMPSTSYVVHVALSTDWLATETFSRNMSRPTRRNKFLNQGYSVPGCERVRMPRARSLLFCLLAVLVLTLMLGVYLSNDTTGGHVDRMPTLELARDRVRDVRANTRWCCIGRTGLCS